jgi:hypothetical protein
MALMELPPAHDNDGDNKDSIDLKTHDQVNLSEADVQEIVTAPDDLNKLADETHSSASNTKEPESNSLFSGRRLVAFIGGVVTVGVAVVVAITHHGSGTEAGSPKLPLKPSIIPTASETTMVDDPVEPLRVGVPVVLNAPILKGSPLDGNVPSEDSLRVKNTNDPKVALQKLLNRFEAWQGASYGTNYNQILKYGDPNNFFGSLATQIGAKVNPVYSSAIFAGPGQSIMDTTIGQKLGLEMENSTIMYLKSTASIASPSGINNWSEKFDRQLGYELESEPTRISANTYSAHVVLWTEDNMLPGITFKDGSTSSPRTRENNAMTYTLTILKDSNGSWHLDPQPLDTGVSITVLEAANSDS